MPGPALPEGKGCILVSLQSSAHGAAPKSLTDNAPRRVALRTAAWAAAGGRKVAAETRREETRAGARPGAVADAVFVRRARRAGGPGRDARRGFGVGGEEQKSTRADLENQKPVFFQHPSLSLTSVVLSRLPASWSGNLKNHGLPAPCVHREALRPGGTSRAAQHPGTGPGGWMGGRDPTAWLAALVTDLRWLVELGPAPGRALNVPEPGSHDREGLAVEPSLYRGGEGPGPGIAVFS